MRFFVFGVFAAAVALLPSIALAVFSDNSVIEADVQRLTFPDGSVATQSVNVTSRGALPAKWRTPSVSAGFGLYSDTCTSGQTLPRGAVCTVQIVPARPGPFSGSLTVYDDAKQASPNQIPIALTILGPAPAPTPRGSIFLNPSSAPPASRVNFSGNGLDPNRPLEVVFDGNHIADVTTDGSGNFATQLAIPDTASTGNHQLCVNEDYGSVCLTFAVEAATATPTPTASPSPSPSASPSPLAAVAPGGGTTPLALLIKPPFVFLPIIAAIGLLAFLAVYLWRVRPAEPISEVTILHRAPPPHVYEAPPPAPPAAPAAPPPIFYESPSGTDVPKPPRAAPHAPPSGADVPPDLPEAND